MKNNNPINFIDYLKFPVIIAIVMIVAGLITAFISDEVAWILIGVSVTALGIFQLFSSTSNIREDLHRSSVIKSPLKNQDKFQDSYDLKDKSYRQKTNKDEGFKMMNSKKHQSDYATDTTEDAFDDSDEYVKIKGKIKKDDVTQKTESIATAKPEKKQNENHKPNKAEVSQKTESNTTAKPENKQNDSKINKTENIHAKNDSKDSNIQKNIVETTKDNVPVKSNNYVATENSDATKTYTQKPEKTTKTENIKPKEVNMQDNKQDVILESIQELVKNETNKNLNPKSELEYMLSKLLLILSSITDTKTAVFAVVNNVEKEFSIESFVTTIPDKISRQHKFPFGDDLISQVIKNNKPEILNSINQEAETDLLKYYNSKTGSKSFIGIPILLEDAVVGVLCVDSNSDDAYDDNLIRLLINFKHLCTAFVSNYNEKYTLYQERKSLQAIERFNDLILNTSGTQDNIIDAIISSTADIFDFNRIGICGYDEKNCDWNIIAINKDQNQETGAKADTKNGMIASTLNKYEPVYKKIDSDTGIRIHSGEPKLDKGFFVSIPIRSKKNNYGALFAEYNNDNYLNESDIKSLLHLTEYAALAIEKINMSEILINSSIIEQNNGMHNKNALIHRIQEEIIRASDFKYKLTLVLFKLDRYDAYEQHPGKLDQIVDYVLATLENNLRAYDILGQTEYDTYGILLIEKDASTAKFWGEKVRTQIANSMIEINSQRFSVTVSVGIAELKDKMKPFDFINNAKEALKISLDKSNSVTVY